MLVEKKDGERLKRLNKTKEEHKPDLRAEREERDRQERLELRQQEQEQVWKERERGGGEKEINTLVNTSIYRKREKKRNYKRESDYQN